MLDGGQMHRPAFAAHKADVSQHKFAEQPFHRSAARKRVSVAAVRAERFVALLHRHAKSGRDRFLSERQMARALDHILKEKVVGALFAVSYLDLKPEELEPPIQTDVIVQ
jgi:hypothetical protein